MQQIQCRRVTWCNLRHLPTFPRNGNNVKQISLPFNSQENEVVIWIHNENNTLVAILGTFWQPNAVQNNRKSVQIINLLTNHFSCMLINALTKPFFLFLKNIADWIFGEQACTNIALTHVFGWASTSCYLTVCMWHQDHITPILHSNTAHTWTCVWVGIVEPA